MSASVDRVLAFAELTAATASIEQSARRMTASAWRETIIPGKRKRPQVREQDRAEMLADIGAWERRQYEQARAAFFAEIAES